MTVIDLCISQDSAECQEPTDPEPNPGEDDGTDDSDDVDDTDTTDEIDDTDSTDGTDD